MRDEQLVLCGQGKYAFLPNETPAQTARLPVRDGVGDALRYVTEASFENAAYWRPHAMPQYTAELDALHDKMAAKRARRQFAEETEDLWLAVLAP